MKIGILGSGIVGTTLASGFLKKGYEVMVGSRDISKLKDWKLENTKGNLGSFAETAKFGEVIVLAVKGTVAEDVLKSSKEHIEGKIIIDTTNPIADSPPQNGVIKFFTNLDKSLMESLVEKFPKSKFVKAFNSIGSACMVDPEFNQKPSMFICGNDKEAKKEVSSILDKFGFEIEDMGSVEAARAIEPLCILWCIPGFLNNDWYHGLKMLKKN